jgi:hypothetical protein
MQISSCRSKASPASQLTSAELVELVDDENETPHSPNNERGQPYFESTDVLVL